MTDCLYPKSKHAGSKMTIRQVILLVEQSLAECFVLKGFFVIRNEFCLVPIYNDNGLFENSNLCSVYNRVKFYYYKFAMESYIIYLFSLISNNHATFCQQRRIEPTLETPRTPSHL